MIKIVQKNLIILMGVLAPSLCLLECVPEKVCKIKGLKNNKSTQLT